MKTIKKMSEPNADIVFHVKDGTEVLRIKEDGSFLVKGEKAATDLEVYEAFKKWLVSMNSVK